MLISNASATAASSNNSTNASMNPPTGKMPHSIESPRVRQLRHLLLAGSLLLLSACETPKPPVVPATPTPPVVTKPVTDAPPGKPVAEAPTHLVRPASWQDLPGWAADDPAAAWSALQASCKVLQAQPAWRDVCVVVLQMTVPDRATARDFFETNFTPYQIAHGDGNPEGLITGYYEPLLRGSRKPSKRYRFAVYGVPDDLLVVDLAELHPELKGLRLRGRLEGRRVVPYYDRAQIESGAASVRGREIVWVDDAIELFFLQIQGSGRVQLDSGEVMRVGYADQNGHPYRSIGRVLIERNELALERASMQGIQAWARQNPARVQELLNQNASYVFFRELPAQAGGPPGAMGIPLTAQRSIAIDPRFVPLGAPVYISTTWPNTAKPLARLMLAQDTGGAIRGPVRGDFFWGFGEEAAREAGRMRQALRLWIVWPRGSAPPGAQGA